MRAIRMDAFIGNEKRQICELQVLLLSHNEFVAARCEIEILLDSGKGNPSTCMTTKLTEHTSLFCFAGIRSVDSVVEANRATPEAMSISIRRAVPAHGAARWQVHTR